MDLAIRSHEQSSLLPKNHPPGTLPADTKPQGRLRVSMLSQVMPLSPLNALPLAYFSLVKPGVLATPSSIEAYASVILEEVTLGLRCSMEACTCRLIHSGIGD